MNKIKPCKNAPRHKWVFQNDITIKRQVGSGFHFSAKGIYRCECGAQKFGNPQGGIR